MDTPVYSEAPTQPTPRRVALSHASIEVGHLYMNELGDHERVRAQFREVAPWLTAARQAVGNGVTGARPRVSTCFLIDDYFRTDPGPDTVIDGLLEAAREFGVTIDYLAREAACAENDRVPVAGLAAAMLLPEPPVGTTGSRPPAAESGWLCNGERSPEHSGQAMIPDGDWARPEEFGKREHSVFLDVEMWSDGRARWSCPFLAAVWQLLRLGVLRYEGEPVARPTAWAEDGWPGAWDELPGVIALTPRAAPFAAYRTVSILPSTYLGIEHATTVILDHLDVDPAVLEQTMERAGQEGLVIPRRLTDRLRHVFTEAA